MTHQLAQANAALDRLIAEFGDRMRIGHIIETFSQAVLVLETNGVQAGLVVAAEAMARSRLGSHRSVRSVGLRRKTA